MENDVDEILDMGGGNFLFCCDLRDADAIDLINLLSKDSATLRLALKRVPDRDGYLLALKPAHKDDMLVIICECDELREALGMFIAAAYQLTTAFTLVAVPNSPEIQALVGELQPVTGTA